MKAIKLHKRILVALVAAAMMFSLIGVQSFAAVDAGGDYDTLYSRDHDINSENVYSYTSDNVYGGYHEITIVGGNTTTQLDVPLTEADAESIEWVFNTPDVPEELLFVDYSEVDAWQNGYEYLAYVYVDPTLPVGPYSMRAYISTDPTVYADFTFVVTDPESNEPDAEDVTG
jgi:hypothetical protein